MVSIARHLQGVSGFVRLKKGRNTTFKSGLILPHIIVISCIPQVTSKQERRCSARYEFMTHNVLNPIRVVIQNGRDRGKVLDPQRTVRDKGFQATNVENIMNLPALR
jgi:hypothetical protein